MSNTVLKSVYINKKTGKFYAFDDPKEGEEKPSIVAVFCSPAIWNAATDRIDKHGKLFKSLNVKESFTANGFRVYKAV